MIEAVANMGIINVQLLAFAFLAVVHEVAVFKEDRRA